MTSSVIVWDIENVPDLRGFAAAEGFVGKSDDEVRAEMGSSTIQLTASGALVAQRRKVHQEVFAVGEWLVMGCPYDTTSAMFRLVFSGVFERYPTIRIVTHHHGTFIPLLEARLRNALPALQPVGSPMPTKISEPYVDHFRNFYCDTAASGFAPKVLELAVDFFGPDRVLFGSDAPFDVQDGRIFISETLRSIDVMAVPPETKSAILATMRNEY